MSIMYDNIKNGKYENKLPYVSRKKDSETHKAYVEEENRLLDLFVHDLEVEYGTENLKGKEKLFQYAWQEGHAYGFNEILNMYSDIVDLVLDIVKANK